MAKVAPPHRSVFQYFNPITTRWMDNDVYGHVNNVVYYSYFDSIANAYLIENDVLNIQHSDIIGLMVHSECFYHASVAYPDKLEGALSIKKLGNSSVTYHLGIFKDKSHNAVAHGFMTHVFVDRDTQTPVPIEGKLRTVLERLIE